MTILIENGNIRLCLTEKADIPSVLEAENAPENAEFVGQWPAEQHESALTDPDTLHLIVRDATGQNAGFVILERLANPNGSVSLKRIVITQKGKGCGTRTISLIKKWCFEVKHFHRLYLDVREHNARAQHVYETQGFVREGMMRECLKTEGGYQSLILMSILEQEYTPKTKGSPRL